MTDIQQWIARQKAERRQLWLMLDGQAESQPVNALFAADLMQEYANLYVGTEFAQLAPIGPWLIHLSDTDATAVRLLLNDPQRHWGWLASSAEAHLPELVAHWQARMAIQEGERRSLYRFQDNRVLSRHLQALPESSRPLLLGPHTSLSCWDGRTWTTWDNPRPAPYPAPFDTPWLAIPEPDENANEIQRHNLKAWLWENHPDAATRLAEQQPLDAPTTRASTARPISNCASCTGRALRS